MLRSPRATVPLRPPRRSAAARAIVRRTLRGILRRAPLLFALLVGLLFGGAAAASGPDDGASVVERGSVRVLFDDPTLEPYARRVAATADDALALLARRLGTEPRAVTVTVERGSDVFNAFATVVPRPTVALRAVFPVDARIGLDARDPLRLLLLHELTHLLQLGWPQRPPEGGLVLPDLGLVGQDALGVVPAWFLEGIATWIESDVTGGGRADDPLTRGLLRTLAREPGRWPSLSDASLITRRAWPGGDTRYRFGAAFLRRAVARHGETLLPELLSELRGSLPGRPFASVWAEVTGGEDLAAAWETWRSELVREADRAARVATLAPRLTSTGGRTALPTLAADGVRLAWRGPAGDVRVARLATGRNGESTLEPAGGRTLVEALYPTSLAWVGDATLLATAIAPRAGSRVAELWTIDIARGRAERVTRGAHAHLARPDPWRGGCALFVRDRVPQGSDLLRICPDRVASPGAAERVADAIDTIDVAPGWRPPEVVWRPPPDMRVVGLASHPERGIALALWRAGSSRLATLAAPEAEPVWRGGGEANAFDPVFTPDGALRYTSDAGGLFEIVEITDSGATRVRTRSVGGADQPSSGAVVRVLGSRGWDLALLPGASTGTMRPGAPPGPPPRAATPPRAESPVRPYTPRDDLRPFGWLPSAAPAGGAELSFYAQDATGRRGTRLATGFAPSLGGHLEGGWAYLEATDAPTFALPRSSAATWRFRAGVWPHTPHLAPTRETALGVRFGVALRAPLRVAGRAALASATLRLDALHLHSRRGLGGAGGAALGGRVGVALSTSRVDRWGVPVRGVTVALRAVLDPVARGFSGGAWLALRAAAPLSAFAAAETHLHGELRAGGRPPPSAPFPRDVVDATLAVEAALGTRHTWSVRWRVADGVAALERLALEPTLRIRVAADPRGAWRVVGGGDLGLAADLVLGYTAPIRLALRGGWAGEGWIRTEVGLPAF